MKFFAVIFLAFLALSVSAQREPKITIDAFDAPSSLSFQTPNDFDSNSAVIVCDGTNQSSCSQATDIDTSTDIVGGERDLIYTVSDGGALVFSSNIGSGEWSISAPSGGSGSSVIQFDGTDNSSDLDVNGLNGFDLTANSGDSFYLRLQSDVDSAVTLTVYEGSNICSNSFPVTGTGNAETEQEFEIPFSAFSGSCNFASVGAIVLEVEMNSDVDFDVTLFSTFGPVSVSASPTVSHTRSPSTTRSIQPSAAATPSTTVCICNCPTFFCGLLHGTPGDDDDNASKAADEGIIYRAVNYIPVDLDFAGREGTDDQDNISFVGGITKDHNDDDDDNNKPADSSASIITGLVATVIAVVVILA